MCNNAHSEGVQNNLQAEGVKFSIHIHRAVDIFIQGKRIISVQQYSEFNMTYRLKEPNSVSMYIEQ